MSSAVSSSRARAGPRRALAEGAGSGALPVWAGSPAGTAVCLLVMVSYAGVARPAW